EQPNPRVGRLDSALCGAAPARLVLDAHVRTPAHDHLVAQAAGPRPASPAQQLVTFSPCADQPRADFRRLQSMASVPQAHDLMTATVEAAATIPVDIALIVPDWDRQAAAPSQAETIGEGILATVEVIGVKKSWGSSVALEGITFTAEA